MCWMPGRDDGISTTEWCTVPMRRKVASPSQSETRALTRRVQNSVSRLVSVLNRGAGEKLVMPTCGAGVAFGAGAGVGGAAGFFECGGDGVEVVGVDEFKADGLVGRVALEIHK